MTVNTNGLVTYGRDGDALRSLNNSNNNNNTNSNNNNKPDCELHLNVESFRAFGLQVDGTEPVVRLRLVDLTDLEGPAVVAVGVAFGNLVPLWQETTDGVSDVTQAFTYRYSKGDDDFLCNFKIF